MRSNSSLKSPNLRSVLPFTYKEITKDETLMNKTWIKNQQEKERNRIQQLEQLFSECDRKKSYDSILKALLLDSIDYQHTLLNPKHGSIRMEDHKPIIVPLHTVMTHFQRLKFLEDQSNTLDSTHQQSTMIPNPTPIQNVDHQEDHHQHSCTWRGTSEKGEPLYCINVAILHPWKQYISQSSGIGCPISTGFCIFHQKFCLDTNKRHASTLEMHSLMQRNRQYQVYPITIPNQYGLCKECFILKDGRPPSLSIHNINLRFCHVPGVRKKVEEMRNI